MRPELSFFLHSSISASTQKSSPYVIIFTTQVMKSIKRNLYFFTGWAGQIMTELLESIQINFKKLTKCKEQWNCTSTSDTRLTGLSAEVDPKRVGSSEKVKLKTPNGNPVQ